MIDQFICDEVYWDTLRLKRFHGLVGDEIAYFDFAEMFAHEFLCQVECRLAEETTRRKIAQYLVAILYACRWCHHKDVFFSSVQVIRLLTHVKMVFPSSECDEIEFMDKFMRLLEMIAPSHFF
jgi:hypothetical protein